jgi:hypothetical protein
VIVNLNRHLIHALALTSPVSLTNLQVSVGGQNVLQSTLQYGYKHFLEQVNLAEQLTSSDFGISTGLINQNYWENSKWYYVNVERGNAADKLNGRNINVSFTNNSNVPIEVMIFIFYSDEIAIDVKTGLVTRHKNYFFLIIILLLALLQHNNIICF